MSTQQGEDTTAPPLEAVGLGLHVFQLWGVTYREADDGTIEAICDCPKGAACDRKGKHPVRDGGFHEATNDPATVNAWWSAYPNANIGVALEPSGLCIAGPDSQKWLGIFTERGLPETVTVQSGGGEGHRHYYYRLPNDWPKHRLCRSGEFDIITTGYGIYAGSRHKSGRVYNFVTSPQDLGITHISQLPEPPGWVLEMLLEATEPIEDEPDDPNEPPVSLSPIGLEYWRGDRKTLMPSGDVDRSATLYAIGTHLAKAGASKGLITKALAERDAALGLNKYTGRRDAVRRYREIAVKALAEAKTKGSAERFTILTSDAFLTQPDPEWIIHKLFPEQGFGLVFGDFGTYKSFLALLMALCIALGLPFAGRTVKPGPVLYVTAEGAGGLRNRIRAIEKVYGKAVDLYILPDAPQFVRQQDVDALIASIAAMGVGFRLIIIDTVSRTLVGVNENTQEAMSAYVAGCDAVRLATGAAVLGIHHTNREGGYRGSNVLPGALDLMMKTTVTSPLNVTVECEKVKDEEAFAPMHFGGTRIDLGDDKTSLVFAYQSEPTHSAAAQDTGAMATVRRMAAVLKELWAGAPVAGNIWRDECIGLGIVRKSSFYEYVPLAISHHLVDEVKGHGRGKHYQPRQSQRATPFERMTGEDESWEQEAA